MNMKEIPARLHWIDWAKMIAIYLVVFGHIGSPFMRYIFSFHMPFFFLISGFLQKERDVKTELVHSLKTLMVPYVIYNVYLIVYSLFTGEYQADYPLHMIVGNQWFLSMACRPLWFLWALFFCRLLYAALPQKGAWVIAVLCIILCWLMSGTSVMKPEVNYFQYWMALLCYPFFVLGTVVKRYSLHTLMDKASPFAYYAALVLTFAFGAYLSTYNGMVIPFRLHLGNNTLLFYLCATLMSLSLFVFIYHALNINNGYVRLISNGTLLIFAVHQSILFPLQKVLTLNVYTSLLLAAALIVVLSALVWLAQRYCPVLIGKWK